jgi:GH18 family chitinase
LILLNLRFIFTQAEYAKLKALGGMMVWGIETDDFRNICGGGKFPLITSMKTSMNTVSDLNIAINKCVSFSNYISNGSLKKQL